MPRWTRTCSPRPPSPIFRFLWSEFCDWSLEMQKGRLDGEGADRRDAANVLAWVLERTLRLLHPVMPFVTEEIWQRFGIGPSISIAPWPDQRPEDVDADAEAAFSLVQDVVTAIRQFRSSARHLAGGEVRGDGRRSGLGPAGRRVAVGADPATGGRHAVRRRRSARGQASRVDRADAHRRLRPPAARALRHVGRDAHAW